MTSSGSDNPPPQTLFERVLLLEDDPAHAHLIRRALKGICGSVRHCETLAAAASEAQAAAALSPFDLIITDLNVPDAAATGNVSRLRVVAPRTPLVVLTSSNSLRDAVEAMRLGADDFLVKDFDRDFKEVLGFALSRVHVQRALQAEKEKLEREMQALHAAIENSADGLAVADGRGAITYSNSALRDFSSRTGGDSKQLNSLVGGSAGQAERLRKNLEEKVQSLAAGAVWSTEISLSGEPNAAFDMSLSVVAPVSAAAEGKRFVVWVRDVQERKRREKFQKEILSTTTHDLKGPLGAILLSSELLGGENIQAKTVKDFAVRIASSAQTAINIIDEFLSARRIQEGAFILKPQPTNVGASVRAVIETFTAMAQAKSLRLSAALSADNVEWRVDRLGFERMLGNLISNAIKFTPKGGAVEVTLAVEDGRLHARVKDSGSGMEPAEVNKLFQRFSRLAKHGDIPGTGLGLFVVKNVVGAHGGTIDITSQPGSGTTFDVGLPADPPVNERGELIALDFA